MFTLNIILLNGNDRVESLDWIIISSLKYMRHLKFMKLKLIDD